MNTKNHELIFREETHQIIGCALEVLNALGHGLLEKNYENALCVELTMRGIPFQQQPRFDVVHKSIKVGEFIPDLIVFERIVVDTKTIEATINHEKGRIINYRKVIGCRAGLILNFKYPKLEWERIVV